MKVIGSEGFTGHVWAVHFMLVFEETQRITISQAADLQAAVQGDETGGEQRTDAKHKALNAVPEAPCFPKHPGVTQAE